MTIQGRRFTDKLVFVFVALSLFVHGMTYALLRTAITASKERNIRWEAKLETMGLNDNALADQLGLLQKEFNLLKQQEELHTQQLQAVLERAQAQKAQAKK